MKITPVLFLYKKPLKVKALEHYTGLLAFFIPTSIFQPIFVCDTTMKSYLHEDYTSFIHLEISQHTMAVEQTEKNENLIFALATLFEISQK